MWFKMRFILLGLCIFECSVFAIDTGILCAIDMGSNNFKLTVGEIKSGHYIEHSLTQIKVGVGDDISQNQGVISGEKLIEIKKTLQNQISECEKQGGSLKIRAVATAAFREAKNKVAVSEIAKELKIEMEIASEERESELAYLVGSQGLPNFAVVDSGSRSVELMSVLRQQKIKCVLGQNCTVFNLGYRVAFTQYFDPAKTFKEAADRLQTDIRKKIESATFMAGRRKFVGIEFAELVQYLNGGSEFKKTLTLKVSDLTERIQKLSLLSEDGYQNLKNGQGMDKVLGKLVMAETLAVQFGYTEIEVSPYQLGTGLIIEQWQ